jgi:hypothetical protein
LFSSSYYYHSFFSQINWIIWFGLVWFQRVTRPRGGINRWFKWLPVSIHKKLDSVVRKICGNSRFQSLNHNIGRY